MAGSFDTFSEEEAHGAAAMISDLKGLLSAAPLLAAIDAGGGLVSGNRGLFYELRAGHALHDAGIEWSYEVPGEGQSTLDFGFEANGRRFRVEMMRLTETAAAIAATNEFVNEAGEVIGASRILRNDPNDANHDPRQSEAGETIKAIQRICQKCEYDGKPHKFPPLDGALHFLLVDFRTFLHGGDRADRIHVALGAEHLPSTLRQYWEGKPIVGVFHPENPMRGAAEVRARVHFLGFSAEKKFGPGEISPSTIYCANPHIFPTAESAQEAFAAWPLRGGGTLNF